MNTSVSTKPSKASSVVIISGYQEREGPITIWNKPTINEDTNTISGA